MRGEGGREEVKEGLGSRKIVCFLGVMNVKRVLLGVAYVMDFG